MKRNILVLLGFFIITELACAYNYDPPKSGENLFLLGFPDYILQGQSISGGAVFDAAPYSANLNPALTAPLKRISADIGFTGLIGQYNRDFGGAFHLGALGPSKIGVFTGTANGVFMDNIGLGNMFSGRVAWARDLIESVYVGAAVYSGIINNYGRYDFAIGSDLGFVWRLKELGFFRDVRVSAVLANLGKNFYLGSTSDYPHLLTLKAGLAALFIETEKVGFGFSFDAATPMFQNIIFNMGLQLQIVKMVTISTGWDLNVHEIGSIRLGRGERPNLPYAGIAVNFTAKTDRSKVMQKNGIKTSDFRIAGVWQSIHEDYHIFSTGASMHFGALDTDKAEIDFGVIE
ncbi:MAG: hypothetical protein Ta2F_10740 [Termitinemataceae bacterium]|nr:MAG: hypothetical protein Ta2F_10740 [Termitinemataceae bacterium]